MYKQDRIKKSKKEQRNMEASNESMKNSTNMNGAV